MFNIAHAGDIDAPTVRQTVVFALRHVAASCEEELCASSFSGRPFMGTPEIEAMK